MNKKTIAAYIDHTNLKPTTTAADIIKLCAEAKLYHFKSVCVNPARVALAKAKLKETDVLVDTVIGFPLGANTTITKVREVKDAVALGADEVDMVINIGKLKDQDDAYILKEIQAVVEAAAGKTVKVIIETCYLTDSEKKKACALASIAGAGFVKTSTGFGPKGADAADVKLMRDAVLPQVSVKASGGIRSYADFKKMIAAGASRIGTSSGVKIMQEGEKDEQDPHTAH